MKVFLDTGAWLALNIKNDKHHKEATGYLDKLISKRALLVTNDFVLSETYTRFIYDVNLKASYNFHKTILKGIEDHNLVLLETEAVNYEGIWIELNKYSDHELSFTDASIIYNFKKFKLDEVFTFDRHFLDINIPCNLMSK